MAFAKYREGLEARGASRAALPLDEAPLAAAHEAARVAALDAFDGRAVGAAAQKYRRELKARVDGEWRLLTAANAAASEAACARAAGTLWATLIEPQLLAGAGEAPPAGAAAGDGAGDGAGGGAGAGAAAAAPAVYADHRDFEAHLAALRDGYWAAARGPAAHRALAAFLLDAVPTVVRALNRARAAQAAGATAALEKAVASLRSQLGVATAAAAAAAATAASLRAEHGSLAYDRARADADAAIARSAADAAAAGAGGAAAALDAARARLRAERAAHARTRVALKAALAAGGGAAGDAALADALAAAEAGAAAAGDDSDAGGGGGGAAAAAAAAAASNAALSAGARSALSALAAPAPPLSAALRAQLNSAAARSHAGSVDFRSIMGGGAGAEQERRLRGALGIDADADEVPHLLPAGLDGAAMGAPPPGAVRFPHATAPRGAGCGAPACAVA